MLSTILKERKDDNMFGGPRWTDEGMEHFNKLVELVDEKRGDRKDFEFHLNTKY